MTKFHSERLTSNFIGLLVQTIVEEEGEEEGMAYVSGCFASVLDQMSQRLKGRNLADSKL